ncbi:MAG: hypothetical protein AAF289_20740 [Cyanobacteria bacterium P01_A01_bin.135]
MLLLLLIGGVVLTDLLAYLPISILGLLHLPRWLAWIGLVAIVAGLMGSGPKPPHRLPPE